MQCRIHIKEHLDLSWRYALGVQITHQEDGTTLLSGSFQDQAELFGLIWKLRSLNLTLLTMETDESLSQVTLSLAQDRDQPEKNERNVL